MEKNNGNTWDPSGAAAAHLAYLGDCVWEILVRRALLRRGIPHPSEAALAYVTAAAQSDAIERILPCLTEGEEDVYRRGRNCVHGNVPKRSTVAQYRRATGLEALFGYLDLMGDTARMEELFALACPALADAPAGTDAHSEIKDDTAEEGLT